MICKFCNANVPDGSAFCENCGNKLQLEDTAPQQTSLPQQEPEEMIVPAAEPAAEIVCPNCGMPQGDADVFCAQCGARLQAESAPVSPITPVTSVPPVTPVAPPAPAADEGPELPKKKKRKGKGMGCCLIVVLAILAMVATVLIVGFTTNWFGFYGPATKIALATKKTVEKESFTAEIVAETSDGDELEGTLQLELVPEERHLELLFETTVEDELCRYAIYDGYIIVQTGEHYYYEDISDDLDEFFEKWNSGDRQSLEEFLKEEIDDVEDHVDFEQLNKCLLAYYRDLNSNSWLKENAGYSKKRENGMTMYCFDVDVYPFVETSFETFEPIFKDPDEYDDAKDSLQDGEDYMEDIVAEGKVGVKGGKLGYLWLKAGDDDYDMEFEVTFDKIGKTDVAEDELDDMLQDAKQYRRDNY